MSKRLQVILSDVEYREIREVAAAAGKTVSEWVRGALRRARRDQSVVDRGHKLDSLRAATRHSFPIGDVEELLADTERGYDG